MDQPTFSPDLSPETLDVIDAAVAHGHYPSRDAVVGAAVKAWAAERQRRIDELRALIAEGDASGYAPWEGANAINAEARRRLEAERGK